MLWTLSIWVLAQTLRNICGDPNPVRRLQPKKVPPGQGGDQKCLSPLLLMGNLAQSMQTAINWGKRGSAGKALWGCGVQSVAAFFGQAMTQHNPSISTAGEGCEASTEEDAAAPGALPCWVFIAPPPCTGMYQ